jgi:PAS domain-containing protein
MTPVPRAPAGARPLGAVAFDAHPIPTLVVDGELRLVTANASARRLFGATEGTLLGDALGCIDAASPGGCGAGDRCGGCAFRLAARRALAGERSRARGFVIRGEQGERGGDVHLIAAAVPLRHEGHGFAILALSDVNAVLGDPEVVRICEGCGRVQDDDGAWHPLHRYLEDHLGIGENGPLCEDCVAGGPAGPHRRTPT